MASPRCAVTAALLLAAALCSTEAAVTRFQAAYNTGAALHGSLPGGRLSGLLQRVVRAAEDEPAQQAASDLGEDSAADAGGDNALDTADGEAAAAPPEVLVPADAAASGRPHGHYHYHDKAGCYGYGYGRTRVIIINNNNTPTESSDADSGTSEQLRAAPRMRRGRSRGRRESSEDTGAGVLDEAATATLTRNRRDAIQNVKKNLKNKGDVIMSRTNDIAEKVNDRMDSVFGDNALYVKAKEMIMGAVGKAVQGAAKVASSGRRRRAAAEETGPATPPRPRKGKAAMLARIMEDMDNIPGRRVAKMVSTPPDPEPLEDPDETPAMPADTAGEAADMLAPRREKRAATGRTETTTVSLGAERDATTARSFLEKDDDEEAEKADQIDKKPNQTEAGGQDIGEELGRRRRDATGAVRLKRDVMAEVKNVTEKMMQRGREMLRKVQQAVEETVKKVQELAKGRSGGGTSPRLPDEPPGMAPEKPAEIPAEKKADPEPDPPEKPAEIPAEEKADPELDQESDEKSDER